PPRRSYSDLISSSPIFQLGNILKHADVGFLEAEGLRDQAPPVGVHVENGVAGMHIRTHVRKYEIEPQHSPGAHWSRTVQADAPNELIEIWLAFQQEKLIGARPRIGGNPAAKNLARGSAVRIIDPHSRFRVVGPAGRVDRRNVLAIP